MCPSGTDADCDCPGTTPNLEVRASSCRDGTCVRPQWCFANGAPCGLPSYCSTMPPTPANVACQMRCCQHGASCNPSTNKCDPCVEDGTTLTTSNRCCLNTFFTLTPGSSTEGKCNACKGQGLTATEQAQCCPGLRFSPIPGTSPPIGQCVVCRGAGQIAGSVAECCPGLGLFPDINSPTVSVCNPCRAIGQPAASAAECCPGLGMVVRTTTESPTVPVCAMPCAGCRPPLMPGMVGRCATGVPPAACPQSGVTPPESCIRNTALPVETCAAEDSDCDGMAFDVPDPTNVVGRPCAMPQLPASAMCGGGGRPNWNAGSYPYNVPPLMGHLVCDPATGTLACTAIPGIDYCHATRNCRVNCAADSMGVPLTPCVPALRHDATTNAGTVERQDTTGTSTEAKWFEAPIYATMTATVPMNWGTFDEGDNVGCGRLCSGETCSGAGSCAPGLTCLVVGDASTSGTCTALTTCVSPERPIVCSNHVNGAGQVQRDCRVP